jgi:hypothetical protein
LETLAKIFFVIAEADVRLFIVCITGGKGFIIFLFHWWWRRRRRRIGDVCPSVKRLLKPLGLTMRHK